MKPIKILLIEDDEDDYIIISNSLLKVENTQYELQWVQSFSDAMEKIMNHTFDVCLLDFRLGINDGLKVLKNLRGKGFDAPIIMLTGKGSRHIDINAMKLGVDDYIEKDLLDSNLLERSIRYSIERWKNIHQLKESERKLKRLSEKILLTQEDERKYIAKELHDSIGSNLTAIKIMLESNKSSQKSDSSGFDFPLDKILTTVMETIKDIQRITKRLRPETLDRLGIVISLQSIASQFSEINKNIHVDVHVDVTEKDVPEHLKITILRIAQEALNNIAKHSEADHVKIHFGYSNNQLELMIKDNGKGFDILHIDDSATDISGTGLLGMRERIELTGGCFDVISKKGDGATIQAFWPFDS